ncbi:MAG: hypothetical protein O3A00_17270 [Planctomycetota bacterium]|nr:hypothetical protein [Planctomycetota bacterium]
MHIFFSVGEPSGDQHAANLIQELRDRDPEFRATGLGGPRMQAEGCRLDFQLTDLAVVGFAKVVPLLWRFLQVYRLAKRLLSQDKRVRSSHSMENRGKEAACANLAI